MINMVNHTGYQKHTFPNTDSQGLRRQPMDILTQVSPKQMQDL